MLPTFSAHLFARLAVFTHDATRDKIVRLEKYNKIARFLREMEQPCVAAELPLTAKQIRSVLNVCDGAGCPPNQFPALVAPIPVLLLQELGERAFLRVPNNRVRFFKFPKGNPQRSSEAEKASREFHSARRCLGLGEPTACVLRLTRVIDFGARIVAKSLGINTDLMTIGRIASEVQNSIRNLVKTGGCTPDVEEFYNALVTDLRAFARGHRNSAVHRFQEFDHDQAFNLITVVGDFMRHLQKNFDDWENPKIPKLLLGTGTP